MRLIRDGEKGGKGVKAKPAHLLGARLLPQSYQYPNLSEGADRIDGQRCGDEECPFSGVTKSGKVWRKVPENGEISTQTFRRALTLSVDSYAEMKSAPSVV